MSKTPVLTAGCYCESVRLELHGLPEEMYLCHCLFCRKELGSLFAPQVVYRHDAVKITQGADMIVRYSRPGKDLLDPKTGITPNAAHCGQCGSPLLVEDPKSIRIRYGVIDAETEEQQAVLNGTLEGMDEKAKTAWVPKWEFFVKRKAPWAKGWSVEGAVQKSELP